MLIRWFKRQKRGMLSVGLWVENCINVDTNNYRKPRLVREYYIYTVHSSYMLCNRHNTTNHCRTGPIKASSLRHIGWKDKVRKTCHTLGKQATEQSRHSWELTPHKAAPQEHTGNYNTITILQRGIRCYIVCMHGDGAAWGVRPGKGANQSRTGPSLAATATRAGGKVTQDPPFSGKNHKHKHYLKQHNLSPYTIWKPQYIVKYCSYLRKNKFTKPTNIRDTYSYNYNNTQTLIHARPKTSKNK